MNSFLNKLNLRPQERRLLVVVSAVLFIVLNMWLVWPHFGDWQKLQNQRADALKKLDRYQAEVNRIAAYEAKLKQLESAGSDVGTEEQALQLQRIVRNIADASGMQINGVIPKARSMHTKTNQFFEEQTLGITITTGDKELVNFLTSLASAESMIRVRTMDIKPDPTQTRLVGQLELVASYQKKTTPKPGPSTPAGRQTANK